MQLVFISSKVYAIFIKMSRIFHTKSQQQQQKLQRIFKHNPTIGVTLYEIKIQSKDVDVFVFLNQKKIIALV